MWFGPSCWLLLAYCIFDALQYPELSVNLKLGLQSFSVRKRFKGPDNPALQPLPLEHENRHDVHTYLLPSWMILVNAVSDLTSLIQAGF